MFAPDKESFAEDIGEDLAESTLEFVDSDVKTSHRLNGGVSSVLENVHKSLSISSSLGENRQSHAVTYVETVKEPVENDSSYPIMYTIFSKQMSLITFLNAHVCFP